LCPEYIEIHVDLPVGRGQAISFVRVLELSVCRYFKRSPARLS
jgi:hypothetical protein